MPALALCLVPLTALAQVVEAPSGQDLFLEEVLLDETPGEPWVRFRFIAPAIAREGGTVDSTAASADMDALCDSLAIPYLATYKLDVARIVISFSDRPVTFGESDPDATQYFEAYRPSEGGCVWEEF